jgi:hypothetical protein
MSSGAYTGLKLTHIASKKEVSIPIQVRNFMQDVAPSFSSTEVYARMDPIFTYKNTVRTFQISADMVGAEYVSNCKDNDPNLDLKSLYDKMVAREISSSVRAARELYAQYQTQALSSMYQFMYPLYQKEEHGTGANKVITHQLKGPPVLSISIPNVMGDANVSFLFVPQTFTVSTGLADIGKNQITLTGPSSLKYLAPQGGYGFTLGGTILHEDDPPGFSYDSGSSDTITFGQDSFPFGAVASWDPASILNK